MESKKYKNTCSFFKQIEENLWRCSFCGETTTENPYGWIDENWREKLKPGWRYYSDPSGAIESGVGYKGDSKLDVGFIYSPFTPKILDATSKDQQSKV